MKERIGLILWLITAATFGSWFAISWLDNVAPYEYLSGFVTPDPAKEGGRVTLIWQIRVNRICPGSVQRILSDEITGISVAAYDPLPSAQTVQMGDTELRKTFLLPDELPAIVGYDAKVCFRCNALQYVFPLCFPTPHVSFRVKQPSN